MHIKTKIAGALMLAVLMVPGISFAQTQSVADLQALIASLTTQVQQLEAQLAAQTGGSAQWCHAFNTNLSIGMSGSEVTALQTALQKDGESVTVSGTFDDQTASAVSGFQQKYTSTILAPNGLSNGTGYAGAATRGELNALFGCTGSNPVTSPIVVNPIVPTSSSPVACSMLVPYCPYGGHSVMESNGCSQTVCNAAPTSVSVTVTSPTAGQTFANGSTMNVQWTPASAGVAVIQLVSTSGGESPIIYANKVDGDPVNYNGSYSFTVPWGYSGSYYVRLMNPENDQAGAGNPMGTVIGQSGVITITAPVTAQQTPTITNLSANQGTATSSITIYGTNLTSGGNPTIQFYSSNGALAGTIDSVAMGYISSQSIVFTPTVSNSLLSALSPGTYQIDVLTPNGTSNSENFTLLAPVVQAPVINSFSVGAGPTFSLSAYNYNTITFQAQCGNFVAVVQPQNGSPTLYPTGSASICNAPQTYSSSSFNETSSIAPQMINVPLSLYNAQGVVDGSITLVGSPVGSNNSGSATLTVNVCNSAGVCVQQSASFPIYAKG